MLTLSTSSAVQICPTAHSSCFTLFKKKKTHTQRHSEYGALLLEGISEFERSLSEELDHGAQRSTDTRTQDLALPKLLKHIEEKNE